MKLCSHEVLLGPQLRRAWETSSKMLLSPFSRMDMLAMLLLSVWCSETTAENSMSPALRMAVRVLYTLPSSCECKLHLKRSLGKD